MPPEKYELRVPLKRLLIGMLLTVVPISLAALWSISQSQRSLERTIGAHFRTIAEGTAAEIAQFIRDRAIEIVVLAREPVIMDEVIAANRAYSGMSDAAVGARIEKIEKSWSTPSAEPSVKQLLSTRASRTLRRHLELDPRYLRITVTDEKGAVIAATHKTFDYYQADEDFWQAIFAGGRGSLSLTDILYDEVTKAHYIGIGAPVAEEGTGRFIGAVDALVDVSTLFPFINRVQIGPAGRAALVKGDGTIICAPNITFSMKLKSASFTAVQDALQTLEGRQTGYLVAPPKGGGQELIGFADTGLKENYKNLEWVVLVSQDAREAFRPIRIIGRLLAFMALVGLATVMFFAVYFSLHRKVEMAEIGELRRPEPQERAPG